MTKLPERISDHITYKEATKSATALRNGIDNTPTQGVLENMKKAARFIFEPVRVHFGCRMKVSSFFRCWSLNKKVGSTSPNHPNGYAIDMDRDQYPDDMFNGMEVTNKMVFEFIFWNCEFRELIWEYGTKENPEWVHGAYVEGRNAKICKVAIAGQRVRNFDPIAEGYISASVPDYCIVEGKTREDYE